MFLHRGEAGLGWEERNGEHPRLRGATFTSKSDCRHSGSGCQRLQSGLTPAPRSPGQPCRRGSPSAKPACVHVCRLHDAWVVKNVQQHRRAEACSSCAHLSARARLWLPPFPERPAGRARAALEVLTSGFHKTTALV